VPLLSLIPLSHLAISEFSLDFSLNISEIIKSKQTDEQQGKQQKLAKNTSPSPRFLAKHTSLNQREDSKQQSDETHLQFNIKATQLPLTNGVLKLLDAFSNVISQPNNQHG
jgi:hypothetical protein